jgi:biopolymer transport protein ExbB
MKQLIKKSSLIATSLVLVATTQVYSQEATSLANLLELVENDRVAESVEYRERAQEFEANAARQTQILETTEARIVEQEEDQVVLSNQFEANEITLADKREILRNRRGDLNELFGTLQGVAGDFLSTFQNSLISAQYLGRSEFIEEFIVKAGKVLVFYASRANRVCAGSYIQC